MKAKEKAIELVNKYKPMVNGYVGSSMLTNTEYPETILKNAKQCALIAVDEILEAVKGMVDAKNGYLSDEYYNEVKSEIEKL